MTWTRYRKEKEARDKLGVYAARPGQARPEGRGDSQEWTIGIGTATRY